MFIEKDQGIFDKRHIFVNIPAGKTMVLNKTFSVIVRSGAVLEVDGGSILNARLVVQKGGTVIV